MCGKFVMALLHRKQGLLCDKSRATFMTKFADHYFYDCYVGKHSVACEEYNANNWWEKKKSRKA